MKEYIVWYIVKKNGHGYLYKHYAQVRNRKEAFQATREACERLHSAHAFSMSTKGPELSAGGTNYNGMIYARASLTRHPVEQTLVLW